MAANEWKPSPEVDGAIRQWMAAQGLPVNSTKYYFDEEVYAWRHEASDGSPTLWIARPVLEDHDAQTLSAALDRLGLAERMRTRPKARFLVVDENGQVFVMPWSHGPHKGE
jgi:hypothetical protein